MDEGVNVGTCAAAVVDYFDDGYTAQCGIPAEPGVHNALGIEYRPCLASETSKAIDTKTDAEYVAACLDLLAGGGSNHLLRWSMKDRNGKSVPINKVTLSRVARTLLIKIIDVVVFGRLPDGSKTDVEGDLKN